MAPSGDVKRPEPRKRFGPFAIGSKVAVMKLAIAATLLLFATGCATESASGSNPVATTPSAPSAVKTVEHTPDSQAKFECETLVTRELGGFDLEFGDDPVRHSSERLWSWDSRVIGDDGQPWRFGCYYYPNDGKVSLIYLDED